MATGASNLTLTKKLHSVFLHCNYASTSKEVATSRAIFLKCWVLLELKMVTGKQNLSIARVKLLHMFMDSNYKKNLNLQNPPDKWPGKHEDWTSKDMYQFPSQHLYPNSHPATKVGANFTTSPFQWKLCTQKLPSTQDKWFSWGSPHWCPKLSCGYYELFGKIAINFIQISSR